MKKPFGGVVKWLLRPRQRHASQHLQRAHRTEGRVSGTRGRTGRVAVVLVPEMQADRVRGHEGRREWHSASTRAFCFSARATTTVAGSPRSSLTPSLTGWV